MSDTMHHKILCFGSLNIDHVYSVDHFVAKGETLSSQKLETFTGGKGLNQSVALARAGAETYHAGAIGPDGSFLLDMMKEAGVHTDYVTMIPDAHTGHAIIQRDKEGDNCILLYGGTNQLITKEQTDSVLSHFSTGDYLVLQNEINQLPYIVEKAHALGMTIVLNPSPMNEKVLQLPLDEIDIFLLTDSGKPCIRGQSACRCFKRTVPECHRRPDTGRGWLCLCLQRWNLLPACVQDPCCGYNRCRRYLHRLLPCQSASWQFRCGFDEGCLRCRIDCLLQKRRGSVHSGCRGGRGLPGRPGCMTPGQAEGSVAYP